jgi:hypothetical protein
MQGKVGDARSNFPELHEERTLGTLKGKIQVLDPNWWKPMTDGKVEDFVAGRGLSRSEE